MSSLLQTKKAQAQAEEESRRLADAPESMSKGDQMPAMAQVRVPPM